jgi:hypothetical protein
VSEPVTIVYAYCSQDQLDEHEGEVEALAIQVCRQAHQEAVALELDNQLGFVSALPQNR